MIGLALKLIHNLIRMAVYKLRYGTRYNTSVIERLSFSSSIRLFSRGSIRIGRNIDLAPHVDIKVHENGRCEIGARTYMNIGCMISCHNHIAIGENCMFGPGVKIFDNNHRFSKENGVSSELNTGKIIIGKNCWIASDVIILKGANIGDNCVIGAGCIIDCEVPPCSIVRQRQNLDFRTIYK